MSVGRVGQELERRHARLEALGDAAALGRRLGRRDRARDAAEHASGRLDHAPRPRRAAGSAARGRGARSRRDASRTYRRYLLRNASLAASPCHSSGGLPDSPHTHEEEECDRA